MKKLLVIGKNWPEPQTTAAGYRLLQLIEIFQEDDYEIHFCCAAKKTIYSASLENLHIKETRIQLNDSGFNDYIKDLAPDIVLYDRFMTEEQYGWRVRQYSVESLHLLDTEDLHFLRKAREEALKKKTSLNIFTEDAMREIAAIYRCDISIIISKIEQEFLVNEFKISDNKLIHIPFLHKKGSLNDLNHDIFDFHKRSHFVMIGNSLHGPNYDAILYLKKEIWPVIRKKLPTAEVHIYGAYQKDKIKQLQNIRDGFIIKGYADDVIEILKSYKILLAPLRFGAGLKGKVFDAMHSYTPVAMTSIAAEGMFSDNFCYGFIEDDPVIYAQKAIDLYSSQDKWSKQIHNNIPILENYYDYDMFKILLREKINNTKVNTRLKLDKDNFHVNMLNYHSYARYTYLSKWIESKL